MLDESRPLFGADRAGQVTGPTRSSRHLHFTSALIADDGDGALGPTVPHPSKVPTNPLRVVAYCQDDEDDPTGGGVRENALRPVVGHQRALIHFQNLQAYLGRLRGVLASH